MFDITSRLEINALGLNVNIPDLIKTASSARVAAVVVSVPEFVPQILAYRMTTNSTFKVILAVDFDSRGNNFTIAKFNNLHPGWQEAEGYEIVLSPRTNAMEIKNEIQSLSNFLRQINPVCEVRFVINMLTFDGGVVHNMIQFLGKQVDPRPTFIRVDQNLTMPVREAVEYGPKCHEIIRRTNPIPLKASTNIDLESIRALRSTYARFDVDLNAAKKIIHQLRTEAQAPRPRPAVDTMSAEKPNDPVSETVTTTTTTGGGVTVTMTGEGFPDDAGFTVGEVSVTQTVAEPFSDPIAEGRLEVPEIDSDDEAALS